MSQWLTAITTNNKCSNKQEQRNADLHIYRLVLLALAAADQYGPVASPLLR